jgi:hypothetical protein
MFKILETGEIKMKTLESVFEIYETRRQKIVNSEERNQEVLANGLLNAYEGMTYTTILDNTTKAQVAFSKNAQNLVEIEEKEVKELENLKSIKNILLQQENVLEDKEVVLEGMMIEKQRDVLNLKNLEEKNEKEKERLEDLDSHRKKDWEVENKNFEMSMDKWKSEREEKLKKEEEQRVYEHSQSLKEIEDGHDACMEVLEKEQGIDARIKDKDLSHQRKEMEGKAKDFEEAKVYIEAHETTMAKKVSKNVAIKLGFVKHEHENTMKRETNAFINKLDILELEQANRSDNTQSKKSTITELKEKLSQAKIELNKLTQNTLTV